MARPGPPPPGARPWRHCPVARRSGEAFLEKLRRRHPEVDGLDGDGLLQMALASGMAPGQPWCPEGGAFLHHGGRLYCAIHGGTPAEVAQEIEARYPSRAGDCVRERDRVGHAYQALIRQRGRVIEAGNVPVSMALLVQLRLLQQPIACELGGSFSWDQRRLALDCSAHP